MQEKLRRTLDSIRRQSTTDWRCFIVHNPSEGDDDARAVIASASEDPRFISVLLRENVGYAGAVNALDFPRPNRIPSLLRQRR